MFVHCQSPRADAIVQENFLQFRKSFRNLFSSGDLDTETTHRQVIKSVCKKIRADIKPAIPFLREHWKPAFDFFDKWSKEQSRSPNLGSESWLHDMDLGSIILSEAAADKLLPATQLAGEMESGHHAVVAFHGIHFKCLEDSEEEGTNLMKALPGVEFMVDRLNKLVMGYGTAPSRLLKLTRGERSLIMQAAKSVEGVTLDYILEQHPEHIDKLDPENFASMALMSMLTNPQDGKADNFMVEIESVKNEKGEKEIRSLHLVSIDNDMAFGESIDRIKYSDGASDFLTEVRNVIYLLPFMDYPIPSSCRSKFLELSPELTLIEWLSILQARNEQYESLKATGIFSEVDFTGDPRDASDKGLQLPICVPQFLVVQLYRRMVEIQEYLRQHETATLHDIFNHVEPVLSSWYQKERLSDTPVMEKLFSVYQCSLGEKLESRMENLCPRNSPGEFHHIASEMIYQSNKSKTRTTIQLTIPEAVEILLLEIPVAAISVCLESRVIEDCPLYNPTELVWQLIARKKLTVELLEFLIKRGANVCCQSSINGYYPLHLVIKYLEPGSLEVIKVLAQAGSPAHLPDDSGDNVHDKFLRYSQVPMDGVDYSGIGGMIKSLL